MSVEIHDLRLSMAWTRVVLDLLYDSPSSGPLRCLSTLTRYQVAFDQATLPAGQRTQCPDWLGRPWPDDHSGEHIFWSKMIDGYRDVVVDGRNASRNLLPLQRHLPVTIQAPDWQYVRATALHYPFALSLVVRARSAVPGSADAIVRRAYALRHERPVTVTWDGGQEQTITLAEFADQACARLSGDYSRTAILRPQPADPFTVVTVVDAERSPGEALDAFLPALRSLTRWHSASSAQPLVEADRLAVEEHPKDEFIAAGPRSRVIWIPSQFELTDPKESMLGNRHTSLTLLSLQVDALGRFMEATAPVTATASPTHRAWATVAARLLGRLYGASSRKTYRSLTVQRQFADSEYTEPTDAVRTWVGEGALTPARLV